VHTNSKKGGTNKLDRIITHTVKFVLALRDSWDGRLIGCSDFVFYLDGERTYPLRKETGFYVFIDINKDVFKLKIEHKKFYPAELDINLNDIVDLNFILQVPLIPKMLGALPLNCVNIHGNADPSTIVYAAENRSRSRIQFAGFEKGNLLLVNNPGQLPILGLTLAVIDSSSLMFEVFTVLKKLSFEKYRIDKELPQKFTKGSLITKAYIGLVDAEGLFSMFVSNRVGHEDYLIKFALDGKFKTEKLNLNKQDKILKVG
jgi:hypothetical protein